MNQFQAFFPSNSSMDVHPDNTISKYTVELKTPLQLEGDYEVGLSQIQYPRTWNNIRKGRNGFVIRWKIPKSKPYVISKRIPPGYYSSIDDLVSMIRQRIMSLAVGKLKGIQIEYHASSRKVKIFNSNVTFENMQGVSFPVRVNIKFRGDVARLLGFKETSRISPNGITYSPFHAMPDGGFSFMYVYCNLIEQQIVGDTNAPCLRTINVATVPDGNNVSNDFSKIFYMPITKRYINSIEFSIADDSGRLVDFDHGKLIIVLHFRRRKNL